MKKNVRPQKILDDVYAQKGLIQQDCLLQSGSERTLLHSNGRGEKEGVYT